MKDKLLRYIIPVGSLVLFAFVNTAGAVPPSTAPTTATDIQGVANNAINIINIFFQVILALMILWLAWAVYQAFFQKDFEKDKGREHLIYGVIGVAALLSFWGLVNIVRKSAGVDGNTSVPTGTQLPTVPPIGTTP